MNEGTRTRHAEGSITGANAESAGETAKATVQEEIAEPITTVEEPGVRQVADEARRRGWLMFELMRTHLKGTARTCAILAPLCMLLEVFMDLQQPTLMSEIIDIGVASGDLGYVLRTGGRMVLFALIGLVGGGCCSVFATYAATHMAGSIRERLFSKIFTLAATEVDNLEASSLVTRTTNDVAQIQEMMVMLLRAMSRSPMLFAGGIIMSFLLSFRLALVLCVALPLLTVSAIWIIRRAVPLYTVVQNRMDRINSVVRENLLGMKVVKAFALENRQIAQFERANVDLADNGIKAQKATFLLMPIVTLVMNLCIVAALWFGGLMQIRGVLPLGKIMAFVNYLVQITHALVMLANSVVNISRSQASALRIREVMHTHSSLAPPEHPRLPRNDDIELRHVSFGYTSGERVLWDIDLYIPRGQKVGIVGATGCGKSTLAALLARLYDPNEGSVCLGGVDVREIPMDVLRKRIGLVPQNSVLFSGTVAENLRYGDESADEVALWAAVATAQADGFVRALPGELNGEVAQRGKNFSGGQKQRLCIARSLLQIPHILILDDATSAVDFITEARLQAALRERSGGITLILVAQRISSIMDCDCIVVMDKGRVAAQGSHACLMESSEIYRSIVLSQLGEEALLRV